TSGCNTSPASQVDSISPAKNHSPSSGWLVSRDTNRMDHTPEVELIAESADGGALTIRCAQKKTDAYVHTTEVVSDGNVRIKFDDQLPTRQHWSEATSYQGLFSPDAKGFANRLASSHVFLFEYTPF